ncbi:SDR family NAD(P)-dependent oxidoreductase [Saccharospirillum salsuginis]|uniref:3-oxoacyl-ACP reductase n=1 Tax=Saccharospirillum salsuginis TaxID=418750 RepID=A0A918KQH4_9GAMM|nr:SDR family oxidoreductase [Saccharospirillum salsuginis]GGX71956.1 3-oxoacyl-ACP reductase [Saccharospirillum salsuginis]
MELPKTPSFRLDGKRALVTGAGRGIGLACAVALAEAGAEVTLTARTQAEIESVAEAIRARGGDARAVTLDVTDLDAVSRFVDAEPPFDVLVSSAGGARHPPALEVTPEDFDFTMSLNTRSAFFIAQRVADKLIRAGKPGSLITLSSQMGHVGGPKRAAYCASKHAVEGFTRSMALELGAHGIRINTLCPTFIRTPLTEPMLADADFTRWVTDNIALGRVGEIEDLMGPVVFLASDASALVTGTALMVDGGWTAR